MSIPEKKQVKSFYFVLLKDVLKTESDIDIKEIIGLDTRF